jgi:hypothetical protein
MKFTKMLNPAFLLILVSSAIVVSCTSDSESVPESDFRTAAIPVNEEVNAPGLGGSLEKLAKSKEGTFLIHTAGVYMGVNPAATEAVRASLANEVQQGKGTSIWTVEFKEDGYVFCNAAYSESSGTGKRELTLSAESNKLHITLWLHEEGGIGPGGTWSRGSINVALVKADKYDGYRNKNQCVGYGYAFRTGGM